MEVKDFETLISELNVVDISLKQSIAKLKNYDVEEQLNNLQFDNLSKKITQKLEKKMEQAIDSIEKKAIELDKKIERFDIVIEGVTQIDDIADNVQIAVKNLHKIKYKTILITTIVTAFSVGLFSFFASNLNDFFSEKIENEKEFIKITKDPYFRLSPSNHNIVYLNIKNNIEVETMADVNNPDRYFIKFKKVTWEK